MPYSDSKIKSRNNANPIKTCSIAYITGFFIFILTLASASFFVLNIPIESRHLHYFVMIATAVSAFVASLFSSLLVAKNRLGIGMGISLFLVISEFLVLLCFNNISLSGSIYVLFPIAIFFGFTGCIIGINIKKK